MYNSSFDLENPGSDSDYFSVLGFSTESSHRVGKSPHPQPCSPRPSPNYTDKSSQLPRGTPEEEQVQVGLRPLKASEEAEG